MVSFSAFTHIPLLSCLSQVLLDAAPSFKFQELWPVLSREIRVGDVVAFRTSLSLARGYDF